MPIVEGILDWVEKLAAFDPIEQERALLFRARAYTHLGKGSDSNWGGQKDRLKELQSRLHGRL